MGKETHPLGVGGGHPGPSPPQGLQVTPGLLGNPLMGLREAHPGLWDQEPWEGTVQPTLRTVALGNKHRVR